VNLPPHAEVSEFALCAIAERHGLAATSFMRLPDTGIFNAIYLLGDAWVLRVPRVHPIHFAALRKEAVAIPTARAAGVTTPRLVAFDESCDLLPVPYSILERVHGQALGPLNLDATDTPDVWRALGRELALLHAGVPVDGPAGALALETMPDPRASADRLSDEGHLTAAEAGWLGRWCDRLAPDASTVPRHRFLHSDVQATNVMVSADAHSLVAVLDWGSCGWGDPAWDFVGMPLRAVPYMLEGYRALHPVDAEDTAEVRITWRQLQIALWLARRAPQPERSWGERPLSMLLDILRFFAEEPGERWRAARWDGRAPLSP
jgi:aminoglycoside phosphotransferase (APT) family kinase protein